MALHITSYHTVEATIVGELTRETAGKFLEELKQAVAGKPKRLVLFMEGASYLESAGLRALLTLKQNALAAEVDIYIIRPQIELRKVIEESPMRNYFVIQDKYCPEN
jgi:anti-anti-sigma factor